MKSKKIVMPKWPISTCEEQNAIARVLESNSWWRNEGNETKQFEKEFSEYHQCIGGIAVTNGTVALEVALKSLGIGAGDEVIVPDFTFYSTISAVLTVQAKPILVDVNAETYCIDVRCVEKAITERTKAIIAVHIAGNIADVDTLLDICKKYNLYLIEDAAHAHGAEWKGRKAGSFGDVSTFSFQNAKLMTAGEGGILLSNNRNILEEILLETNCGRAETDTSYNHIRIGTNARLSEVQSAILRVQLSRLQAQTMLRISNYKYLHQKLKEIRGIELQEEGKGVSLNPHYMVMFQLNNYSDGINRDSVVANLKSNGFPANRAYRAIHELPIMLKIENNRWGKGGSEKDFCDWNSTMISNNVICLSHVILLAGKEVLDKLVEALRDMTK